MRELALFAGAGGGILGSVLLEWHTVCAVEIDPYCVESLLRRQADGSLSAFPIWDDVRTFDGRPWNGQVDVITGGFPCQDISCAGRGEGITGARSSLFFEMLRIIEEVRPRFVVSENAKELRTKGLGAVVEGLSRLGYVGCVGVLGARHVGANHWRKRMWIVATDATRQQVGTRRQSRRHIGMGNPLSNANENRQRIEPFNAEVAGAQAADDVAEKSSNPGCIRDGSRCLRGRAEAAKVPHVARQVSGGIQGGDHSNSDRETVRLQSRRGTRAQRKEETVSRITDWWDLPRFTGVDDGGAHRMDRVRATGNMQVPAVVALAWEILKP